MADPGGRGFVGRETIISAELHHLLAIGAALLIALAGLEAGWRVARGSAPGLAASRLDSLVLLLLGLAIAAGLGLLIGGARPKELLHFVYAVVAIGAMPIAASFTGSWEPRRRAIATAVAAIIALAVVVRLFATG